MAVSLLTQPASISFSGNEILYQLKTTGKYSSQGQASYFRMNAWKMISTGDTLTLKYNGLTLVFNFVTTPDDSGFQLSANINYRNTAAQVDQWHKIIAAELASNYYINRDFVVTTGYQQIQLTARTKSSLYNIEFSGDGWYYGNDILGLAPAILPNFRVLVEVWVRRFGNTDFELADVPKFVEVDENNEAICDISSALNSYLASTGYDKPDFNNGTFETGRKNICEYFIKYAETYGSPQRIRKVKQSTVNTAILGGFAKPLVGTDFKTYFTAPSGVFRFLSNQPTTRKIRTLQKDYLLFVNLGLQSQVTVEVTVTFSDNTTEAYNAHTYQDILNNERLIIPSGVQDLNVHLKNINKSPVQYAIRLKSAGVVISETITYQIDYEKKTYAQPFLGLNSFGCYEGRITYGKKSREYELLQEQATRTVPGAYRFQDAEQITISSLAQHKENVTTGYKSKRELFGWEEFFKSPDKYLIRNGRAYPVNLSSRNIKTWTDGDNLTALEFELSYAYTDAYFSADEFQEEPITIEQLIGWVPAVSNPDPINFDDRYYLKSEVYNKAQIDLMKSNLESAYKQADSNLQSQITSIINQLGGFATAGHTHDDLYISQEQVLELINGMFVFRGEWYDDVEDSGIWGNRTYTEHNGLFYKSLVNNNRSVPGTDSTKWMPVGGSGSGAEIYMISGGNASGATFHPSQQ